MKSMARKFLENFSKSSIKTKVNEDKRFDNLEDKYGNAMIQFVATYDLISESSAEVGDYKDIGYIDISNGNRDSTRNISRSEIKELHDFYSDTVDFEDFCSLLDRNSIEYISPIDKNITLAEDRDYKTGETLIATIHIENVKIGSKSVNITGFLKDLK